MAVSLRGLAWVLSVLLYTVLLVIGINTYYIQPLQLYPFSWAFELAGVSPSPEILGLLTFFVLGATPVAALLLLFDSVAQLILSKGTHSFLRLNLGVFCTLVGIGFLTTLAIYVIRVPEVLDWNREFLAALVHVFIAGHGLRLVSGTYSQYSHRRVWMTAMLYVLWFAVIIVPQHPWLVVWLPES